MRLYADVFPKDSNKENPTANAGLIKKRRGRRGNNKGGSETKEACITIQIMFY